MGDDDSRSKLEKIAADLSALTLLEASNLAKLLAEKQGAPKVVKEGVPKECDPNDAASWSDDDAIKNDDSLIRLVFTSGQIRKDANQTPPRYTISPQAFE